MLTIYATVQLAQLSVKYHFCWPAYHMFVPSIQYYVHPSSSESISKNLYYNRLILFIHVNASFCYLAMTCAWRLTITFLFRSLHGLRSAYIYYLLITIDLRPLVNLQLRGHRSWEHTKQGEIMEVSIQLLGQIYNKMKTPTRTLRIGLTLYTYSNKGYMESLSHDIMRPFDPVSDSARIKQGVLTETFCLESFYYHIAVKIT